MRSTSFDVTLSNEEYGLENDELTFRYTEKRGDNWKVERYQLTDDFGMVFSAEKVWRKEETEGFLGLWKSEEEVYEEEVEKRLAYDKNKHSVITEESSWNEFREILKGTEAHQYLVQHS